MNNGFYTSYFVLGEWIGGVVMRKQVREYMLSKSNLLILILLCLIFGVTFFGAIGISTIQSDRIEVSSFRVQPRKKIITRVLIEKDDTLWNYACQYYSKEYKSVDELIAEIKRTNGLSCNLIKEGSYLLIPHYVTIESGDRSQ